MLHSALPASTATASATRAWILTLAAGLAAALITWTAAESLMRDETGSGSSRGAREPISPVVYTTRNGMTSYGILGATLGLGLGLAGGLLRGSARSAGLAGLLGLVLGGAAGAAAAKLLIPFYFRNYSGVSLSVPLLVHGGLWSSIGIAAGLAFGLGLGGPHRALESLIYAILGAVFATFLYEFASVWLFPAAQPDRPLPVTPGCRLFAYLVSALVIGAAMALGASRARPMKTTAAPSVT